MSAREDQTGPNATSDIVLLNDSVFIDIVGYGA